jgi:hypothetical protein
MYWCGAKPKRPIVSCPQDQRMGFTKRPRPYTIKLNPLLWPKL